MKPPSQEDRWVYGAKAVRVVDGDTVVFDIDLGCAVELKDRHCRLRGIDAPESSRGPHRGEGRQATFHLESLLLRADHILLRTYKDKEGSFSRLLVEIWDGDKCLNEQMVEDGFAVRM